MFEALGKAPGADYMNALRWYNHILSYGGERNRLVNDHIFDLLLILELHFHRWKFHKNIVVWVYMYFETFVPHFSFGGQKKAVTAYGDGAAPAAAGGDDSDSDVDLFGSDDEEESEEAKKVREERLAQYAAKKSTSKFEVVLNNIIVSHNLQII